jgi:hypothetical protein
VQVVVQRPALTEELRAEDDVVGAEASRAGGRVKPTGIVDLMTAVASGLMVTTSETTCSTLLVSK